ncbi:MAG TPA: DUF309 domain-containing protein [Terracidiphilus sp.]|nr:DUF309 domain-containing protein [Terracidiphilus sp.]
MPLDWSQGELAEGLRCYRAEQFFLAHEHWEAVWLQCCDPEKAFLQGLIQIAAAFHHLQRNNALGASSLLQGALRRLDPLPPHFGGIALGPLRENVRHWLQALSARDSQHPPFPEICCES